MGVISAYPEEAYRQQAVEDGCIEDSQSSESIESDMPVEMMPKDPLGTVFSIKTFLSYTGSGWLMSLAYLDPGNLESDLQSGAYTGYNLLWVLFTCTGVGLLLQVLAARLGVVTGRDLAQTCKLHYSRGTSRAIWIMTEVAIIGADVQEVVGSAIALNTLLGWPLWLGSLVTGLDTFTFLLIDHYGKRMLELFIFSLILVMMVCFVANWAFEVPPPSDVIRGFVPTCPSYAVLQLVGTIGAAIMPHNVYLHSALVLSRGVDRQDPVHVKQANKYMFADSAAALVLSFLINAALLTSFANGFFTQQCAANAGSVGPLACVPEAAGPSSSCVGPSCLSCLTATGTQGFCQEIGLDGAGVALEGMFGGNGGATAKYIFAFGLLAAGQASTMTGTFAGQYVMEGFTEWRLPMWVRTLVTRLISLVPAIAVALWSTNGGSNFNEWLNILQSVQLPFAILPILHFNSDPTVMGEDFVLSRRWQAVCWGLAAIVVAVNFYLVSAKAQAAQAPLWVMLVLVVAFVLYLAFICTIIQKDLKRFSDFVRSRLQAAFSSFRWSADPESYQLLT